MMLRGIKLDFFKVAPVVVAVIAASAGLRNCVLNERARGVDADSAFHDALSALGVEVKAPGELSVPLSADTGDSNLSKLSSAQLENARRTIERLEQLRPGDERSSYE